MSCLAEKMAKEFVMLKLKGELDFFLSMVISGFFFEF